LRFRRLGLSPPLPAHDRLELPAGLLDYRIRCSSRRRTLALRLDANGALTVSAPQSLPLPLIREFVASRQGWIDAKRALLAQQRRPPLLLESGTRLPYLGTGLELEVIDSTVARCRREAGRLVLQAPGALAARRALEAWFRRMAARHFSERVEWFVPIVGRAPASIAVRAQRSRWGSCSSRGTVSLNWRLMQATGEIIDYVIVHELCHLLVPNHSPRFWSEVARVLPDWQDRRQALRVFGRTVVF